MNSRKKIISQETSSSTVDLSHLLKEITPPMKMASGFFKMARKEFMST
jgi:hypothetical protein